MQRRKFQVISPIDGSIVLERNYANDADIEQVLSNTKLAQALWTAISLEERANLLKNAVQILVSRADQLGEEITFQMGRPIRYTPNEIRGGLQERANYMIDIAADSLKNIKIDDHRFISHEPLGTALVLAPWNYPYLTSVNAIIPALMSGNSVILKHSEQTPLTAERYAEAFSQAGLPTGVFQYLHIDHDQVATLIRDERIDYVAFTGSVRGGLAIQMAQQSRFINSGLELGGKDPAYVRPDANIDHAAENLVDGSFFNSGQSCCGVERIYVHHSVYNDFVEKFVALTKRYKMGNPTEPTTEIGPMATVAAAESIKKQIAAAVKLGAQKHIGKENENHGAYVYPEVLTNVNHDMEIMQKEVFGPVVGIMSVKNDEEAINLMNDSEYGLTASIWTRDEKKSLEIGKQLQTGTVFMNRCDYLDPALAWTGVKNSGKGCTLSKLGYNALTRPKSYHFRKL